MGVIYRLTGTDEAHGWLELARSAETIEDVTAFLSLHSSLMRKVKITRAPAVGSGQAPARVRQRTG
jgi:hypothetical protein